jgi:hypothetical protein
VGYKEKVKPEEIGLLVLGQRSNQGQRILFLRGLQGKASSDPAFVLIKS